MTESGLWLDWHLSLYFVNLASLQQPSDWWPRSCQLLEQMAEDESKGASGSGDEASIASDVTDGHCTYALSGDALLRQSLFECVTCGLTFEHGTCVCSGCFASCHAGHVGWPVVTGRAYCDCGKKHCRAYEATVARLDDRAGEAGPPGTHAQPPLARGMDESGRITGVSELGLDFGFRSFPRALEPRGEALQLLRGQCETLNGEPKATFWVPLNATPRTPLEALAQSVFQAHVGAAIDGAKDIDPTCTGAEFWTQVKAGDDFEAPTCVDAVIDPSAPAGIGMHFDKDEAMAEEFRVGVFPALSTVTYLSEQARGGPPTIVFDRVAGEEDEVPIMRGVVSHPRPGKHITFDGRLLHGVPPTPELREAGAAASPATPRITFLVNVWINHHPRAVHPLADAAVKKLNTRWVADGGDADDFKVTFDATKPQPATSLLVGHDGVDVVLPFLANDSGVATLVVHMKLPEALPTKGSTCMQAAAAGAGGGSGAGSSSGPQGSGSGVGLDTEPRSEPGGIDLQAVDDSSIALSFEEGTACLVPLDADESSDEGDGEDSAGSDADSGVN